MAKEETSSETPRFRVNENLLPPKEDWKSSAPTETPEARLVMAGWVPEDWTPPATWGRFRILDICPEAPAYFAKAGFFTVRDLRTLVSMFDLQLDPRDGTEIWRYLLQKTQDVPWILPVLEVLVAQKRSQKNGAKSRKKSTLGLTIAKLPISKLRLNSHPELQPRVGELLSPPVEPDVAVAAFCEYALSAYFNKIEEEGSDSVYALAKSVFTYKSPEHAIGSLLGEIEDVEDWNNQAHLITAFLDNNPDFVSETIHAHAIAAVQALSRDIKLTSDADDLSMLGGIAVIAANQLQKLQAPRKDALLAQLKRLGLEVHPDDINDDQVPTLLAALETGVAGRLRQLDLEISDLEESVIDVKEQIAAATAAENYARLGTLGAQAAADKAALEEAQSTKGQIFKLLEEFMAGLREDDDAFLEEIRALVAHEDAGFPEDFEAGAAGVLSASSASDNSPMAILENDEEADEDWGGDDNLENGADASDQTSAPDPAAKAAREPASGTPTGTDAEPGVSPATKSDTASLSTNLEAARGTACEAPGNAGVESAASITKEALPGRSASRDGSTGVVDNATADTTAGISPGVKGEAPAAAPATEVTPAPGTAVAPVPVAEVETQAPAPETQPEAELDLAGPEAAFVDPPAPVSSLVRLIERDLLGVAADAAQSFEADRRPWPIEASALRVAAGSRATRRGYGADTQQFLGLATRASGESQSEAGSALLLGALLRPAIFEAGSGFRNVLPDLCRGALGTHLQESVDAISRLEFDFPPDADELARLSGVTATPQKQRFAEQIGEWCDTIMARSSRWPFATAVMHHAASDAGPIGAARTAIAEGHRDAVDVAHQAIKELSSADGIEALAEAFSVRSGRFTARLHPKGIEYLVRQFDEPLGLLDSWVRAATREGSHRQQPEVRVRTAVGNLVSRLEKATSGLSGEARSQAGTLHGAVAGWIAEQIQGVIHALRGEAAGRFATLEEALVAERDLLPATARAALDASSPAAGILGAILTEGDVPDPEEAFRHAIEEGAFETAGRLATRFGISTRGDFHRAMTAFAEAWESRVEERERRLKTLSKVDYMHQSEINRYLEWCHITRQRLAALKSVTEIHDLSDIPAEIDDLDEVAGQIEEKIRQDQVRRIGEYRTEGNTQDADALAAAIDTLAVETIEDRIAQLRDGRSVAFFETDLSGLVDAFTGTFLPAANGPDWPAGAAAWENAAAAPGPLHIEEDRRTAGLALIELYQNIVASMTLRKPEVSRVRAFLEDIGYDAVKIHNLRALGRTGAWAAEMTGTIQPGAADDWFLPPVFGSQANGSTRLLLIGSDTLPEMIIKTLSPDTATILLFAGAVDTARRHELSQHLRAGAFPALVIDEALVAFTATRRETRAQTIFECGLPYGRVEPYATDAGKLPPEMFFGRAEEMRLIMSKTASGCLVYGGRQLGKSALLGHIARTQHAPAEDRIVVTREVRSVGHSEKSVEIWTHLAAMLSPEVVKPTSRTADAVEKDIREWITMRPHGRIIAMFDEADHFMDADTRDDYPQVARLKKLMEETGRAFKVIFAGLHNVQRMLKQPNSPLAHLEQPICIGPLNRTEADKRAAYDLVVKPMQAAGFRFETPEAVEEILAWANYYPSLIQEYMKGLLSALHGTGSGRKYHLGEDGPLWPIATGMLFSHRTFGHIEHRIREKFHWTLNLDPRYALVAYTLGRLNAEGQEHKARVAGFEPAVLLEEASLFWPKASEIPSASAFEALLDELFDLGVLGRVPIPGTKRFRYLLGSRQVATMLGSEHDIYHALQEIEDKDPTVAYDRAIHRRRYKSGSVQDQSEWLYTPLTDLQIERVVLKEEAAVRIVCGLETLGLSKVGPSLKRIAEEGRIPGSPSEDIIVEISRTQKELRTLVDRAKGSRGAPVLAIYTPGDPVDARKVIDWLETQKPVLDRLVRPIIVLDAANTGLRDIANRLEQSQFLSAWGAEMVRMHLHQLEKPELDTKTLRGAILDATGGIPSEVVKLVAAMRTASDPLATAKAWTANPKIPKVLLDGPLGVTLRMLDVYDDKDYEAFDDLVLEATGFDLVSLGPDLVATGLVSTWKPREGHIRRSALGSLLCRTVSG
ncbi:hypothetical protein P6F26_13575 [Roseibacterium sp. SDUM158017]|uniref:hypothetical protein n=1 Tax=Roseicyclus salinarum TaxID=3036773 RepID=UPI002415207D|nr:hypothetical protein [Roseibacterium sp. SDUM158017]MDG4649469.1 hypothetical protein [Roseibacterium sp. SDUM158017]